MFRHWYSLPSLALAAVAHGRDPVDSSSVAGVRIPQGATLLIAADSKAHQLSSPVALAFDDQGRIFIAETRRSGAGGEDNRDHPERVTDDLASTSVAERRALFEKLPPSGMAGKSDQVRRLADTDGDGALDESKVFADGFNDLSDGPAAGILAHEGALYLGCIPKLLMLRDTDGDGRADERKTIADGFGVRVSLSDHALRGFTLGPDGRIYGAIGDRGFSFTTREGVTCHEPGRGAAFRFEADGSGFEVFHTGLRNPGKIAFDALGYPFCVDNGSGHGDPARVVYLVEGGDSGWEMEHGVMLGFHRQIGLADPPPNRWMDENMWQLARPDQPAYIIPPAAHLAINASGLTCHPGAGFLESEAGRFLVCDHRASPADSGIGSFGMKPDGAGMKMTDYRQVLGGVAASDAEYSWDGRIFLADFGGGWRSGGEARLLSLDAGSRTWRAGDAASAAEIMRAGFASRGAAELANLLKHPDARIRIRAQIALTRMPDAFKRLSAAALSSDFTARVHAIRGLGILARCGPCPLPASDFKDIPSKRLQIEAEAKLVSLLEDKNEEIRCQALRALADATIEGTPLPLGPLLADPSPRVRFFAAMLAGKRRMIGYYGPICDMLAENDNRDPLLRHAGVFALQNISPHSRAIHSLVSHPSPAVRLAAVVALRRMRSPDVAGFIRDSDPMVADEAIRAVCDLDLTDQRPAVATLLDDPGSRQWPPFMLRRLLHNSFRIGDAVNAARVFKFATDSRHSASLRKEALRLVSEWTRPFPADQFTGHWRPLAGRDPAIIAPFLAPTKPPASGFPK